MLGVFGWSVAWVLIALLTLWPQRHYMWIVAFPLSAFHWQQFTYSAFLGFFRQFELIFITADERDVIRLCTNFRQGEEVYLYRTRMPPATARLVFLTYVRYLNKLRDHPEWYNALTRNPIHAAPHCSSR